MKITRRSLITHDEHTQEIDVTQQQLDRWTDGELIQNAAPRLTKEEREFLMTGITADEWKQSIVRLALQLGHSIDPDEVREEADDE
jgi:hypothetical protein|tara:strand:- start:90 stop:347 length:258 start_codon:yes stop_codon:yes gene_type:complete